MEALWVIRGVCTRNPVDDACLPSLGVAFSLPTSTPDLLFFPPTAFKLLLISTKIPSSWLLDIAAYGEEVIIEQVVITIQYVQILLDRISNQPPIGY